MNNWRSKALLVFLAGLNLLVIGRLFYWQIIKGEEMSERAEKQHWAIFDLPAKRGEIKFADGSILAGNQTGYLLYGDLPKLKEKPETVAKKIGVVLVEEPFVASSGAKPKEKWLLIKEKEQEITELLNQQNVVWVSLAKKIEKENKEKIEGMKIAGLSFQEQSVRNYPESSMAAHLLGFVGSDEEGRDKGYFGLEGYYDKQLTGKDGKKKMEKDAMGRPILTGETSEVKSLDGKDIVTTLDRSIQYLVEKHLKEGIETWQAKSGSVLVMNPQTGAILAAASFPSYDPQKFYFYETALYKNPLVSDLYEPGSIVKPLVMAAAINEGLVKPQTVCDKCSGPREVGGYLIRTFNNQYHPNLTMTEVLENSDNTGMVFVADKLGLTKIYDYFSKLGFSEASGVDLQEETAGKLKDKEKWYEIDLATSAFGQGISINGLQFARAFGALANNGVMTMPYLFQESSNKNKQRVIFRPQTAKTLTEMLVLVAEKSPLHFPKDKIKGLEKYKIAAKSGTAQIPIAGHYDEKKTIGSVIGYAPADNPKFLVMVKLMEPQVRPWGSDTAGPIFFNIVNDLLKYYNISPDY